MTVRDLIDKLSTWRDDYPVVIVGSDGWADPSIVERVSAGQEIAIGIHADVEAGPCDECNEKQRAIDNAIDTLQSA